MRKDDKGTRWGRSIGRRLAVVIALVAIGGQAEAGRISAPKNDFWTSTLHVIERQGTLWSPPPPQPQSPFTLTSLLRDLGFDKPKPHPVHPVSKPPEATPHAEAVATGLPVAVPPVSVPMPGEAVGRRKLVAAAQEVVSPSPVPEPSTVLIAVALVGAAVVARRRSSIDQSPFSGPPGPA
jgi:hypothetical protein